MSDKPDDYWAQQIEKDREGFRQFIQSLRAENEKLKAQVLVNKSVADAAFSRADEAHGERADVLLRLSAETSNRVFTDSEMVKLEIRAEAAEAKVLSLTKEINSWVDKMVERDDTISALTERVKELERGQSKGFNEGYDAATRQFSPLAAPEKKPCGKCVDGIIDTRIHPGSWSTKPCPACCPPSPGKDDKTGGA